MIPIRDLNPSSSTPFVTYALIGLNVLVFLYQMSLSPEEQNRLVMNYGVKAGFTRAFLTGNDAIRMKENEYLEDRFGRVYVRPTERMMKVSFWNAIFPFLGALFLHGSFFHILGNMWFLYIFGDNVEDRLGHLRYLVFYLAAGIAASLAQMLMDLGSTIPTIGASGAISGVLGAYAIAFPRARIFSLILIFIFPFFFTLPAIFFLFIWFGIQLTSGLLSSPGMGGVAFWAHIGGFLVGMAAMKFIPPRGSSRGGGGSRRSPGSPWGRVRDVDFELRDS